MFTSGGSEASNQALKGAVFTALGKSPASEIHLITSAVEHPGTLEPCAFLERLGCAVTILPVDRHGLIDLDALRRALARPTLLVSIMACHEGAVHLSPVLTAMGVPAEVGQGAVRLSVGRSRRRTRSGGQPHCWRAARRRADASGRALERTLVGRGLDGSGPQGDHQLISGRGQRQCRGGNLVHVRLRHPRSGQHDPATVP